MELNKNKGLWYSEEIYPNINKKFIPGEIDDIAYHLYCSKRIRKLCIPQVTFIHNSNLYSEYYRGANRIITINRIKENIKNF